jgi:hypothetical protein
MASTQKRDFLHGSSPRRRESLPAALSHRIAWIISQCEYFHEYWQQEVKYDREYIKSELRGYTGIRRIRERLRGALWHLRYTVKQFAYYIDMEYHSDRRTEDGGYYYEGVEPDQVREKGYVFACFIHDIFSINPELYDWFVEKRIRERAEKAVPPGISSKG